MRQPRKNQPTGPSRFLSHPRDFGHVDPPVLKPGIRARERGEAEAAQIQSHFAHLVRDQMDRLGLRTEDVASTVAISSEQLNRYLRGQTAVSLARMQEIAAAVALDIRIGFVPTE